MVYLVNDVSFYYLWNSLTVALPLSPHKTIFKNEIGKFTTYDRATESTMNYAEIHFPK